MPKGRKHSEEHRKKIAASVKKYWIKIPVKKRKERTSPAVAGVKKFWHSLTPEERSKRATERSLKIWKKASKRKKKVWIKSSLGKMTKEQISERNRKANITRWKKHRERLRMRISQGIMRKTTFEQRQQKSRKANEALLKKYSKQEFSDIATKRAEKRRKEKTKNFAYVQELPVLNLLARTEVSVTMQRLQAIIDSYEHKFGKSFYLDDIMQEVNLGALIALSKWDKKMPLEKLARDAIELQLFDYFTKEKRIKGTEKKAQRIKY